MELEMVKHRVLEARPGFPREYGPQRPDKQPGIPFFPQEITRDLVVISVLIAIMYFLSGYLVPALGPARSPQLSELIVPDWYLLFSWGLLKVAEYFPQFTVTDPITGTVINFNPAFWGDILSGIPVIFLVLLVFLDRGREARPAKAPFRSAFGVAFLIVFIFVASLYAIREVIFERWRTPAVVDPVTQIVTQSPLIPDPTLVAMFLAAPFLVGLVAYVALRRLAYRPMRSWLVATIVPAAALVAIQSLLILLAPGWLPPALYPYVVPLSIFLFVLSGTCVAVAISVLLQPETRALKTTWRAGVAGLVGFAALYFVMRFTDPTGLVWILAVLLPNMNTLLFLPLFVAATGYFGLRRPYSTYEYLLNECYQCGKCHTVCPVTKVEDDALGGLNLVYNTFKKQHDGVPLWTCLACDACSAVCPLDIKYSDYILEERAKAYGQLAADGGEPR